MQLDWYILHGTGNRYGTITGFKVNCGFKMSRCENHHSWPESKRWHNSSSVCSVKIVTQTSRMSSYHMCYCFILRGGGVCAIEIKWLDLYTITIIKDCAPEQLQHLLGKMAEQSATKQAWISKNRRFGNGTTSYTEAIDLKQRRQVLQ